MVDACPKGLWDGEDKLEIRVDACRCEKLE